MQKILATPLLSIVCSNLSTTISYTIYLNILFIRHKNSLNFYTISHIYKWDVLTWIDHVRGEIFAARTRLALVETKIWWAGRLTVADTAVYSATGSAGLWTDQPSCHDKLGYKLKLFMFRDSQIELLFSCIIQNFKKKFRHLYGDLNLDEIKNALHSLSVNHETNLINLIRP